MSGPKGTRLPPDGKREICRHYLRNACDYGSKCFNIHERPSRAPAWSSGFAEPHFPSLAHRRPQKLSSSSSSSTTRAHTNKRDATKDMSLSSITSPDDVGNSKHRCADIQKSNEAQEPKSNVAVALDSPSISSPSLLVSSSLSASPTYAAVVSTTVPEVSTSTSESRNANKGMVSKSEDKNAEQHGDDGGNDDSDDGGGVASVGESKRETTCNSGRIKPDGSVRVHVPARCRYYLRKHLVCKNGNGCRFYHDPEFERAATKLRVYECACGQFSPKSSCADCYAQIKVPNLQLPCRHAAFGCRHRVRLAGGSCTKCYENRAIQCAGCQYDSGRDPTISPPFSPPPPPPITLPPPPPREDVTSLSSASQSHPIVPITLAPTSVDPTPEDISHRLSAAVSQPKSANAVDHVPVASAFVPSQASPPSTSSVSHYVSTYPPPGFFVVPTSGHIHMSVPSPVYGDGDYTSGPHEFFAHHGKRFVDAKTNGPEEEGDVEENERARTHYHHDTNDCINEEEKEEDAEEEVPRDDVIGDGGNNDGDDSDRNNSDHGLDLGWHMGGVASYHETHSVAHYMPPPPPPSYMTHASVAAASGLFAPFRSTYRGRRGTIARSRGRGRGRGFERYVRPPSKLATPNTSANTPITLHDEIQGGIRYSYKHTSTLYRGALPQPRTYAPHDVRNRIAQRPPSAPPPSQVTSPYLSTNSSTFHGHQLPSFSDVLLLDPHIHTEKKDTETRRSSSGGGDGDGDGVGGTSHDGNDGSTCVNLSAHSIIQSQEKLSFRARDISTSEDGTLTGVDNDDDDGDYVPTPADKGPTRVMRYSGRDHPRSGTTLPGEAIISLRQTLTSSITSPLSTAVATTTTTSAASSSIATDDADDGSDTNPNSVGRETSGAPYPLGATTTGKSESFSAKPDLTVVLSPDEIHSRETHKEVVASTPCTHVTTTPDAKRDEQYASVFTTFSATDCTSSKESAASPIDTPRSLKRDGMLPETLQIGSSLTSPSAASATVHSSSILFDAVSPTNAPATSSSSSSSSSSSTIASTTSFSTILQVSSSPISATATTTTVVPTPTSKKKKSKFVAS
jgi:hypothetical protein